MDIHQVSVNYLHEQDRILVRINSREGEEIRLWLTRRLCQGWVPMLRTAVGKLSRPNAPTDTAAAPSTDAPINTSIDNPAWANELKQLQDLKQADFKTPFVNEVKTWPIGPDPLLVTTIRMSPQGDERLEMAFEETLVVRKSQARGFQVSLEATLLNGFMHLLEQAVVSADWQMEEYATNADGTQPFAEGDDLASLQRPKYLH